MGKANSSSPSKEDRAILRETAMDLAGIGVLQAQTDGMLIFADRNALAILELTHLFPETGAAAGIQLNELILPGLLQETLIQDLRRTGFVRNIEQPFKTLHGKNKWALLDAQLIPAINERAESVHIVIQDITARKLVEETKYAEFLRRALSAGLAASPLGMVLWEPYGETTHILDWNAAAEKMFGWKREEVINKDFFTFFSVPTSVPRTQRMVTLLTAELFPRHLEHECITKNNLPILVQWFNSPIVVQPGQRVYVVSLCEDLSERKRTEEALRESELRYRHITEAVTDYVYSVRIESGYPVETLHGPGCEAVTGYSLEEFRSAPFLWIEMVPESDRDIVRSQAARILSGQEADPIEHRIVRKDGSVRWVRNTTVPQHGPDGRMISYDGLIRDITEQKQAEDALRESEEKYRTILQTMEDGYYEVDLCGNFTFFNEALCRLLGLEKDEMPGLNYRAYISPDQIQGAFEAFNQVYRTGESVKARDWQIMQKDHTVSFVEISIALLRNRAGNPIGFRGLVHDITSRKRAEEVRRQLEAQIQQAQKLESLGVLAGGIAHDFNNLLMSILGNIELTAEEIPKNSCAEASLREIETASKRAADLCRQMLAYAGKGKFIIEPVNLTELVKEIAPFLRISVSKKASLSYECQHPLPPIEADSSQIRQIVLNLIANASEALEDKTGIITIRTGFLHCSREYLANTAFDDALPEGDYAYLEVRDTGVGITEETRQKLFDPFFSTKFTGRGLGMAAVLGIVRSHHGAIRVESEPGKGSVFRVLFPVHDTSISARPAEPRTAEKEKPSGGKILVIDDEEAVRTIAKRMLERYGFDVLTACDGQEGVDLFRQHASEIQVVVLDLTMPNMNGEEAYRLICQIRPEINVIFSSGYSEQEISDKFAAQRIAGFIQKPYQAATLMAMIRKTLGQ